MISHTDHTDASTELVYYDYDTRDRLLDEWAWHNEAPDSQDPLVRPGANNTADDHTGFTYDANGFMTSRSVFEGGVLRWNHTYTPDVEDRLATYTRTDHGSTGAGVTVTYKYTESGVRVSETQGANQRHFLIDAANPTGYAQVLVERTGGPQSSVQRRYALGHDVLAQKIGSAIAICWDRQRRPYSRKARTRPGPRKGWATCRGRT